MNKLEWKIMVVDDDRSVHEATEFALGEETICGRGLRFLNAYSATQARSLLEVEQDVAVILLDVVMESTNAGLDLIKDIRALPNFCHTRLVIRTGQSGYAPEREVMRRYEIDDYRSKHELTYDHLLTMITGSIRTYAQSNEMQKLVNGLEEMAAGLPHFLSNASFESFGQEVMAQLSRITGIPNSGLLLIKPLSNQPEELTYNPTSPVLVKTGAYRQYRDASWGTLPEGVRQRATYYWNDEPKPENSNALALKIRPDVAFEINILMDNPTRIHSQPHHRLLEIFCKNVSLGFENLALFQNLTQLAATDMATGLPSKAKMFATIREAIREDRDDLVVALVELPEWDLIGSGISPEVADQALADLATWLQKRLPKSTFIARVGDNRLGLLLRGDESCWQRLYSEYQEELALNLNLGHLQIPVRPKVGLSSTSKLTHANAVIREAFLALTASKQNLGKPLTFFSPGMSAAVCRRLDLSRKLAFALEHQKGLSLVIQPIKHLGDSMLGGEVLARWQLPDQSMVPPSFFIPIAEATGQILQLGGYVFREACELVTELKTKLNFLPQLSLNISVHQLQWRGFVAEVEAVLEQTGADPNCIEIEITESTKIENVEQVVLAATRLRAMGFRIALDDFGTGFSSLTHLLAMPLDTIKMDYQVTSGIDKGERHFALARSIIQLAHDAGFSVTAEGVERESQENILRQMGCDKVQGFFFAKPMSKPAFQSFCQQHNESIQTNKKKLSLGRLTKNEPMKFMFIDEDSKFHQSFLLALEHLKSSIKVPEILHRHSFQKAKDYLDDRPLPTLIFVGLPMENPSKCLDFLHQLSLRSDFYQCQVILCYGSESNSLESLFDSQDFYLKIKKSNFIGVHLLDVIQHALRTREEAIQSHDSARQLAQYRRQLQFLQLSLDQHIEQEIKLKEKIEIDALTGISSRVVMEKALHNHFAGLARTKQKLAVFLIDIDYFKKYNDMYGHLAGDVCLRRIAQAIKGCCERNTDICARYGGEEFAIIAPFTDTSGAKVLAEKILLSVRSLAEPHFASPKKIVTVSVGVVVCLPRKQGKPWQIVAEADRALYVAKASGRDTFYLPPG